MTRVTQMSMANLALAGLQANLSQLQSLQDQASSGKRIHVPSDDPQGTAISMRLRSQQVANTQFTANAGFASSRLDVADNALQSISSQLRAARDLVVRSQDGQMSPSARSALSAQLQQIKGQVLGLYNSPYQGRPVFGGTTAADVAIDDTGSYVGDGNPVMVRLNTTTSVRVDVDGSTIGADSVPALMDKLAGDVTLGTGAPPSDLDTIDAVLAKVASALGDVGAAEKLVATTKTAVANSSADLTTSISQTEDADLAEVLTKFASQQVAYQTAIGVAAKIQQNSLLDFLR